MNKLKMLTIMNKLFLETLWIKHKRLSLVWIIFDQAGNMEIKYLHEFNNISNIFYTILNNINYIFLPLPFESTVSILC